MTWLCRARVARRNRQSDRHRRKIIALCFKREDVRPPFFIPYIFIRAI